ncbi:MAG: hypothetical protein DRQ03_07485 [Candidatus Hydrothermota bacterium]|nr:MAG: hypothetical protein DRQ03_07485 [Candidatus Hydrothermae bacterium]
MKILQVSDSYLPFPGGVAEHMYNLKKALEKRGHDVWVLTTQYYGDGTIREDKDEYRDERVIRMGKVVVLPPLKMFNATQLTVTFDPLLHLHVRDFIRRNRFDVVHLHGPLAPNLPGIVSHYSPYPQVATFHTAFVGFNWNKIGKFLFYRDSRKIRKYIFVSRVAKDVIDHVYKSTGIIIPNGIDFERFHKQKEKLIKDRTDKILVGFLSRLEPRKGLDILIKALAISDFLRNNVELIVGGDGPLRKKYEFMARDSGIKFKFLGQIERGKVPVFYKSLDVFVAPSRGGESFGMILLEAMASGVPVIASDIPGYMEVIKDGFNGILFKNESPECLSRKLIFLIKDNAMRNSLVNNALSFARKYDWEIIAERIEEVYLEVT